MSIFKKTKNTQEKEDDSSEENLDVYNPITSDDYISNMIGGKNTEEPIEDGHLPDKNPVGTSDDYINDIISGRGKKVEEPEPETPIIDVIIEEEVGGASALKEMDAGMLKTFIDTIDQKSAINYVVRNYSLDSMNKILSVDYFVSLIEEDNIPKNLFQVLNDKQITINDWSAYFVYLLDNKLEKIAKTIKLYKENDVGASEMLHPRVKAKQFFGKDVLSVLGDYMNGAKNKSDLKKVILLGNVLSLNSKIDPEQGLSNLVKGTISNVTDQIAEINVELEDSSAVNLYLIKSIMEYNQGNFKSASKILNKVSELDYKNKTSEYMQTLITIATKGDQAGMKSVESFLEEHPDYTPAVLQKATLLKNLGNIDESVAVLEQLDKQGNNNAKQQLLSLFLELEQYDNKKLVAKGEHFLNHFLAKEKDIVEKDKLYFKKGILNKELDNLDAAVEDLGAAFKLNNAFYEALRQKSVIQRTQGNFSAAKKDLKKVLEATKDNKSPIFFELGLTLFGEKDYLAAYEQFQSANKGTDSPVDCELYLAMSLQNLVQQESLEKGKKQGYFTKALRHLSKARDANVNDFRIYLVEGNLYNQSGKNEQAINSFNTGLELDKGNIELLVELGKTQYNSGDVKEAKHSFVTVAKLIGDGNKYSHEVAYRVGICDFDLKNYAEVAKSFSEILDKNIKVGGMEPEDNPLLLYYLGESFYHLNDHANAVKPLEQLVALRTGEEQAEEMVDVHKMLGDCYFTAGDNEMAKRSYQIVMNHREDGDVIFSLAMICDQENDPEAVELYKQAIDKNTSKEIISKAWFNLGNIYLAQKNDKEAIQALDNSIESSPKNREAYLMLAGIFENNNPQKANQYLDKALKHFPDDAQILEQQISQLTILGEKEKILSNLNKLVGKNPDKTVYYDQKSLILEKMGRFEDAEQVLEQRNEIQKLYSK